MPPFWCGMPQNETSLDMCTGSVSPCGLSREMASVWPRDDPDDDDCAHASTLNRAQYTDTLRCAWQAVDSEQVLAPCLSL